MYAFARIDLISALVLVVSAGFGCTDRSAGDANSRVYVDDLGRTVQIPARPARVVSLAPNLTEIMYLLGAEDLLVAVTMSDDYPAQVEEVMHIGAFPLNHEAVVAESPDIILATDQVNSPLDIEPISELGIPAVFLKFESVDDIILAVGKMGDLLGFESEAQTAADQLTARWEGVQSAASQSGPRPKLLLLIGFDILYSFGGDSYTNQMIEAAGAIPVTAELPGQSAVLSDEFVLGSDPDIILVAGDLDVTADDLLEHHPAWDALPAIQRKQVYSINADWVFRPGPRVIDGTERMSEIVAGVEARPQ